MEKPVISVIVPVYNVENYLERCVNSLLAQTFASFEILLVDDGSKDRSGRLCDELAGRDDRIRVIHKENGGLSDARNAGIDAAEGEYLCFIDSDDYIEPEMLQVLHRLIAENQADISVCGICDCYESGRYPQSTQIRELVFTGTEALKATLEGKELPGSVCTKLIRRDLLANHRFATGKTYEDAFITPELLLNAKLVAATTQSLYNYWHRDDSITTRPFSQKNMDAVDAYAYTLEVIGQRCPELTDVAMFRLFWAYFVVLDKMLVTEHYQQLPQYKQVVAFLQKNWMNIVKCGYFQKSRRLAAVALKLHVQLYRLLVMCHNKTYGVYTG